MRIHPIARLFSRPAGKVAAALLFLSGAAAPATAAYDLFNYADGPLEGGTAGTGWTSPWQPGTESAPPIGTSPFQVQAGQLKLDLTDTPLYIYNESDVVRTIAPGLTGATDVYMSFEFTAQDMGTAVVGSGDTGYAGVKISFGDNLTNMRSSSPMVSVYQVYRPFGNVTYQRVGTSVEGIFASGVKETAVADWSPGQTYQVIGKLEVNAVNGTDERWTVWIDPADEAALPQTVLTKEMGYDASTQFTQLQMWHYIYNYENTQDSTFDRLRLGTTWASVVATPGDTDGDDDIDDSDLGTAFSNYTGPIGALGGKTNADGDFDGDGDIDDSDLGTAFSGYTGPLAAANVPEPTSLSLLAAAGLLLSRRRRA